MFTLTHAKAFIGVADLLLHKHSKLTPTDLENVEEMLRWAAEEVAVYRANLEECQAAAAGEGRD